MWTSSAYSGQRASMLYVEGSIIRPSSGFLETHVCRRCYLEQEQKEISLFYTQALPAMLVVRVQEALWYYGLR